MIQQARKRIMSTLEKMISERRRNVEAYCDDFLQNLLHDKVCSNEVPSLTDAQIQDNILTMIIAGEIEKAYSILHSKLKTLSNIVL